MKTFLIKISKKNDSGFYGPIIKEPAVINEQESVKVVDYEVVKGDTLWKIAKKLNVELETLLKLNPKYKDNPKHIEPGWLIKVPAPMEPGHKVDNLIEQIDATLKEKILEIIAGEKWNVEERMGFPMPNFKIKYSFGLIRGQIIYLKLADSVTNKNPKDIANKSTTFRKEVYEPVNRISKALRFFVWKSIEVQKWFRDSRDSLDPKEWQKFYDELAKKTIKYTLEVESEFLTKTGSLTSRYLGKIREETQKRVDKILNSTFIDLVDKAPSTLRGKYRERYNKIVSGELPNHTVLDDLVNTIKREITQSDESKKQIVKKKEEIP